jgi:uncharacterized membrane protein
MAQQRRGTLLRDDLFEEHQMKMTFVSGGTIAAAAVALAIAGTTVAPSSAMAAGKVHCFGVNSCKGHSDCKTANNACKGQNSCKGQGFLFEKSKHACLKLGGKLG